MKTALLTCCLLLFSVALAWSAPVTLTVVGTPATGPWGVEGTVADTRDVMADVLLDGALHHTEHNYPYGFPDDNGTTATTAFFGNGSHTVEFIFKLEGTTTEIGSGRVTVQEGTPQTIPGKVGAVSFQLFSFADPQGLAWTANTEPDLAGYRVYWGTQSRVYGTPVSLPMPHASTATVSNLSTGASYYFAVTAYDLSGNESGFSNEVTRTIP